MNTFSEDEIYKVNDINVMAKNLLEGQFFRVCVIGEVSGFASPVSGHWYFTLKDDKAQLRAAMFKMSNQFCQFRPKDGLQVIAIGKLTLFAARGEYQIIVDKIVLAGEGLLKLEFEKLKQKLASEGLFDAKFKQPIPSFPQQIGVITSSTGAAIHDILTVLERRFPAIPVVIYPALVQGDMAQFQIMQAIQVANERNECDVLLLSRGGGSLEDLWAFNEERVARAIFASKIPIVSAVGHEVDYTIADYVADVRAPTPSAGAELLSPNQAEWHERLQATQQKLYKLIMVCLRENTNVLSHLSKRLIHPAYKLQDFAQRLDDLEFRMKRAMNQYLKNVQLELNQLQQVHLLFSPFKKIELYRHQLNKTKQQLFFSSSVFFDKKRNTFHALAQNLNLLSPLATLSRGFSITKNSEGQIIKDASALCSGDKIITQLSVGCVTSQVI